MNMSSRNILLFGASGLIGRFVTDDLRARGFRVVGIARSLSSAQTMSSLDLDLPILSLDVPALTRLLDEQAVDVVVNCLGVLQDGPRLFLIKALIVASLVAFWLVSGFIALFVSYRAAAGILSTHGFPTALVDPITIGTSLMDMSIGVLIAFRRTCAIGLLAGIMASLGYMVGAAILTPDLWIEPLGALVKTGPAIVLTLVALLMLDNR